MKHKLFQTAGTGRRTYKKPTTEILPLTNTARQYLTETRKLDEETIAAFGLGSTKWGEIALPYRDHQGDLELIKFRHATGDILKRKRTNDDGSKDEYEAKTFIEPGGKPVLFGSQLADPDAGPLTICFGDYDAMAVSQDGVPNCVSMPFGDGGLQFIDIQWQFLEQFDEIILYPDADQYPTPEAEKKAQNKLNELAMRLGKHRVRLVDRQRMGAKDANEILIKFGAGKNKTLVETADWFPSGIVAVADYIDELDEEGTPFGISAADKATGGACGGQLIVISGDNGAGKTTVVLNFVAQFIANDLPVFIWSGEQKVGKIRYWFERITAGTRYLRHVTGTKTGFEYHFPHDEILESLRGWYRNYLFQLTDIHINAEEFFVSAEISIRRHGCKAVVIDNLMAFTGGEGDSYFQAQGDFAQNCKRFAEKWNIPVILIAHNKKEEEGKLPTKNSVEGSKKITNWADVVFQMFRVPDSRKDEFGGADAVMLICKTRESGVLEGIRLFFSTVSNRFWQMSDGYEAGDREFGWENYESN